MASSMDNFATKKIASPQIEVLMKYQTNLELSLLDADLPKLSLDLYKNNVILKVAYKQCDSLDPDLDHLEPEAKVRYLLKLVYERVREDVNVYDRLIKVLSRLGGEVKALCGAMGREVDKATGSRASGGSVEDTLLVEQDVPYLVEALVSGCFKWNEIGIALKLPKHKLVDCGKGEEESVSKLSNILTTWILGSYEGARPATLSSLREALASETVGLGKLAQKLKTYKGYVHFFPSMQNEPINFDICYQSWDTKVAEGKSSLLEVQVSCSGSVSYQWSKDGEPLLDEADFSGVCSNILYINRASQCTEGKYSCCVSRGSETVCSDEMSLSVIYPPEKQQLLEFYSLTEREVSQDSWPPVGNSTFINLVLIRQKPMSTCDYYTIRGDMDDILESKEVAEYEEVFREYKEGALVLVEGRPGSGKTTLVHKLTGDWASGKEVLQGAKMVFLVTLRLLHVSGKDKNLIDLLQQFYSESFSKVIEKDFQETKGKEACFILDGLDEYPIESKKNLVIDQLLFTKAFLPHSMVIVASRPVATKELRTKCRTRIEVVGFSKDQIYSYVRSYPFNDCSPTMASKMIDYLDQHPNVLHMCYLPVHASMICFLFSQQEGNIPHRETQIYEKFTIATLLKHNDRKGEEQCFRSLEDLNGKQKESFNSICKLAFDMIVNSTQVVSESDAKVLQSLESPLDLLTVEHMSKFHGSKKFFTFSHLTFQEFLAAYYFHKIEKKDKKLIKKDSLKNVWKFFSGLSTSVADITFLKKVIQKFFNVSYGVQLAYESQKVELCDYVLSKKNWSYVLDSKEDKTLHVSSPITTATDFIALGYMISTTTKSLNEIVWNSSNCDREGVKLFISKATDEKLQSIKYLTVKCKINEENFKALNYLLFHLPFLKELNMSRIPKIEHLTSEVELIHLEVLKLSIPLVPPCSHPEGILKQLTFNSKSMSQVFYEVHYGHEVNLVVWSKILRYVFGCQTSPMSWLHFYNIDNYPSLPHERLSHCTEVVLVNCCIGDEGAEILTKALNTSVLENLVLDFNRIRDSGAVALAGCLARCSVVQEVSIQCNCIGDSGAAALADALVHCSSLRRLDLQGNRLGDKGAVAIAKATESLPSLDLYLHNVNISEEGVDRVLKYRAITRIRSMEFTSSWDSVSEGSIDTLKRALYCGYLPALKLSSSNIFVIQELLTEQECVKNVIGIECGYAIGEVIDENTVPTLCGIINHFLNLHFMSLLCTRGMCSAYKQSLSHCLKNCKSLHSLTLYGECSLEGNFQLPSSLFDVVRCNLPQKSLTLSWVDISSYGVDLLFKNRKSWINLHTLKLVDCSINSDDAQVLSRILRHCKKLCCLDLSRNIIRDRGALAIAEGLKDHTSLLELNMSDNDITSKSITALSQVIKCNHLQHLNLSMNRCVPFLLDVMCQDNLQTLKLRATGLVVDSLPMLSYFSGVTSLAEGLRHCTNLRELDLGLNYITSHGVTALCRIMKFCKYLRRLDISSEYHISDFGVDDVATLVGEWQHKSVLTLDIDGCIDIPHNAALKNGEKCCSSCDHLLELYYNNDYVYIPQIPKLVFL